MNTMLVSDAEKDKIKGEVKEVANTFIKGCEEANLDMCLESWLDSPDLVFVYNGNIFNYKETIDAFKPVFSSIINQKATIKDEKYNVLDSSTVLLTINIKFESSWKDGHSSLWEPCVLLFIFKKIDSKWRVIYFVESAVEQDVMNSEISN